MQTFLQYATYPKSAKTLDPLRRNKQVVEVFQIRKALADPNYGWQNHPAVLQWKGYEKALCAYAYFMHEEFKQHNKKVHKSFTDLEKHFPQDCFWLKEPEYPFDHPHWLGNPKIHDSHKSKLLFKGAVDGLVIALSKYFERPYQTWRHYTPFAVQKFPKHKSQISYAQKEFMIGFTQRQNVGKWTNYYEQFGWNVPDNLSYVWGNSL